LRYILFCDFTNNFYNKHKKQFFKGKAAAVLLHYKCDYSNFNLYGCSNLFLIFNSNKKMFIRNIYIIMANTIQSLNVQLDSLLKPLFDNKLFVACLGVFLAVYAGWLAPALPNSVIGFFDTAVGKLIFIFLIAFVASRNVPNSFQVALIVSVGFLVTLSVLNNLKMKEAFVNLSVEHFDMMSQMNELLEHLPESGGQPADAAAKPADAAPKPEAAASEPQPMSCDDVLNKCYSEFTSQQQEQVCGGLFEEPTDKAVSLPQPADFQNKNCGGYIRQCMANPQNVSTKKYLSMKSKSCGAK